jgi:hypothetical protein
MSVRLLIPPLALVCLAAAPPPRLADVANWVEVPVPKTGTAQREAFADAVGNSRHAWAVSARLGRVVVKERVWGFTGPKPPFPLLAPAVSFLVREHARCAERVEDGWLVAYNGGEWGGALWWFSPDGKRGRKVSSHRVNQFVRTKDGLFAVEGLAHGVADFGSVVRLAKRKGDWKATTFATLPACGWAAAALPDGTVFVAAGRGLVRVTRAGKVEALVGDTDWWSFYPNSLAVGPDGTVYLGMRGVVAAYDPRARRGQFRALVPTREFLRPQ